MNKSSEESSYQEIFKHLLNSIELQPLNKFKSNKASSLFFPDATIYPDFFNNNLLSPGRVIKHVRGPYALIRSFYYQLMKLAFEIEYSQMDYVQVLKSVIFQPDLMLADQTSSPISGRGYTDRQYKRLIAEFIELMEVQSIINFELSIMQYPVVDEALCKTFQNLLNASSYSTNYQRTQALCQIFKLNVQKYNKCYQFLESDVFLYEENEQSFYIAFVSEMAEVSDNSQSTHMIEEKRQRKPIQSQIFDDYSFPTPPEKYRYSAQLPRRNEDSTLRNTTNQANIKDQVKDDQGVNSYGLSLNLQPDEKKSKIGSLLDMMSDRSSKQASLPSVPNLPNNEQTPQNANIPLISQKKTEEQKIDQGLMKIESIGLNDASPPPSYQANYTKRLYDEPQEQTTPQFSTNQYFDKSGQHYNPFTKKYSQIYMGNLYQKNKKYEQQQIFSPLNLHYNYSTNDPNARSANLIQHKDFTKPKHDFHSIRNKYQPQNKAVAYETSYLNSNYDHLGHYNIPSNHQTSLIDNKYSNLEYNIPSSYQTKPIDKYTSHEYVASTSQDEDLFYKPRQKSHVSKGIMAGCSKDQSKGSIYRQFTDTRVQEVMCSFERKRVRNIRQKFKGVHRKDLRAGRE